VADPGRVGPSALEALGSTNSRKMAPKAPVDKKQQAAREKVAVDKTFGMKNKNKSKTVQKYIKSITANMKGESFGTQQAELKEKKDKEAQLQQKAVLASLFNQQTDKKGRAYDPVAKKAAKQLEEEAIASGKKVKEDIKKEIIEGVANTIRLTNIKGVRMSELGGHAIILTLKDKHPDTFKVISLLSFIKAQKVFWVDDVESTNPTLRCQDDVDGEEEPDERAIEEILDERRKALPPGGTPVTEASFKAWKEKREADEKDAQSKRIENAKKGGAKGMQGLSGRDLFVYDASLFVDDEDAVGGDMYDDRVPSDAEEDEADEEKKAADDSDEDEEEGEDTGAKGSGDVAINKDLFLEGEGDLPDDLDDLDDD